jgi:hypothetical protein
MTEKEFSIKVVNRLSKYFMASAEVWSECGKNRIDFILTHRKTGLNFGLEFKRFDRKRGEEIGEFILQAQRYSKLKFKILQGYAKVPVLICPPLSYNYLICRDGEAVIAKDTLGNDVEHYRDRHQKHHDHHTVNGFLGAFGVGEVRTETRNGEQYLKFIMSNRLLWSESKVGVNYDLYNEGLHIVNYEKAMK